MGDDLVNYAVKVCGYTKRERYGDINDIRRPENADILMLKLLSRLVVNSYTPHIVLPICTFNSGIKPFIYLTKKKLVQSNKYGAFYKKYKKGELYNNVSVLINEWCNGGDLMDYIKKNYKTFTLIHWKVLFFQLLSALAVIQKEYPSFRHNDLKPNNILVQTVSVEKKNRKIKYNVNGHIYLIPNVGFSIKIWDFDFACIPGVVDNAKVYADWTDYINIRPKKNRYYDVHYFFNTFPRKAFFPQLLTDPLIPQEVKDFVGRVVPPEFKEGKNVAERGRILVNKEYTTPNKLLKTDPFFEVFRYTPNVIPSSQNESIKKTPISEKISGSEKVKVKKVKVI